MNRMERGPEGQAELKFLDGEYEVVRPGSFVVCAVSGAQIPLEMLRYWSVDLQEAYATPAIALGRMQQAGRAPK